MSADTQGDRPTDRPDQALNAHAEPPTTSDPAAPRPRRKALMIFAIVAVLALALAGGLAYGAYSIADAVEDARLEASSAIDIAEADLESAETAAVPGTTDADELVAIEDLLNEARRHMRNGSMFDRKSYEAALENASKASERANAIVARMERRFRQADSLAQSGSYDEAIDAYFRLYEQYPDTDAGASALEDASDALLTQLGNEYDSLPALSAICEFCDRCPGQTPQSARDAAHTGLTELARSSLQRQLATCTRNREWADSMLEHGGAPDTLGGMSSTDTTALKNTVAVMNDLGMEDDFEAVYALLLDACKLGEECTKIEDSPTRIKEGAQIYREEQVKKISSLCKEIQSRLDEASDLLTEL